MSGEFGDFELRRPPQVEPELADRISNAIMTSSQSIKSLMEAYGPDIIHSVVANNPQIQEIIDPETRRVADAEA